MKKCKSLFKKKTKCLNCNTYLRRKIAYSELRHSKYNYVSFEYLYSCNYCELEYILIKDTSCKLKFLKNNFENINIYNDRNTINIRHYNGFFYASHYNFNYNCIIKIANTRVEFFTHRRNFKKLIKDCINKEKLKIFL